MNGTGGTYDYNQSTSAKLGKSDTGFISKYVNGASVSGVIVEDTVTVGNSTVDSLLFGVANKSAASFIGKTTSGILGLGFPSANRSRYPWCSIHKVEWANGDLSSRPIW